MALVTETMQSLRPIERQVVLLACVEKLPQADVAAALDLPVNTVKTHLRRARLALGRALVEHGLSGCPESGCPESGLPERGLS
jgi:RNA polymerase sigma-70 factor (ECF subfamily)